MNNDMPETAALNFTTLLCILSFERHDQIITVIIVCVYTFKSYEIGYSYSLILFIIG